MFTCSVILTWPCFLEVTSWIPRSLKRQLLVINGIGVFTGLLLNYVKALKRTHKPAKGFNLATVFWGGDVILLMPTVLVAGAYML